MVTENIIDEIIWVDDTEDDTNYIPKIDINDDLVDDTENDCGC